MQSQSGEKADELDYDALYVGAGTSRATSDEPDVYGDAVVLAEVGGQLRIYAASDESNWMTTY